ncbi:MAG: fumarate reductase/succinate dehydrogenase flavoprotein subunit [Deltaproteobacteria bacterium]|nr:fumarate reductase/succinate dehydrogenase flavoprotein subunit [Deltaproteobacteria bacterium]
MFETFEHDVLVIGAGGAGLRAAIEAHAMGAHVGLLCKSLLGKAHTVMAEGGIAAALANNVAQDNWQAHFRDTMRGGKLLGNWRMAQIHAMEASARVMELEQWGAMFDRTSDGRINQRNFGGHRYPRLAHVGDRTGLEMIRSLQDHSAEQDFKVYMEFTAYRLLKDGDRISGVIGYWRETGRFALFRAKAVVLATGGIGKCWQVTSNSWEYTGDGHAMAYVAGAELIDMEFVQFHPTGMVWPPSIRGTLVTEAVRGEGGVLLNGKGERFMFRYIPAMFRGEFAENEDEAKRWLIGDKLARRPPELLTRDVISRAIVKEIKEGRGTAHGGVSLDIATQRTAEKIRSKLPSMYHQFKELGDLDITKQPMEVGPTTHYVMGGVRVDPETAQSTISGLFAAGECAGGMHGANRLGGNSLSDLLVFGRRAGASAAEYAKALNAFPNVDEQVARNLCREMLAPFDRTEGENPFAVTEALQTVMQDWVGIVRTEEELVRARKKISSLKERALHVRAGGNRQYNPGWHQALDLMNLLVGSEMVILAAIERKESRGAHTRIDFPKSESKWAKVNVTIYEKAGQMHVKQQPLPEIPEDLRKLVEGEPS